MFKRIINNTFTLVCLLFIATCAVFMFANSLRSKCKVTKIVDVEELRFEAYMKQFNKSYKRNEYGQRLKNFKEHLKEIKTLNSLHSTEVFGLTEFSDMSKQEFESTMLIRDDNQCTDLIKSCPTKDVMENAYKHRDYNDSRPSRVDWRKMGVISPVLHQKQCYGCWAISIVGLMETMAAINKTSSDWLSIQELLDCSNYTNSCLGGSVQAGLDFICTYHLPITTEEKYPLTLSNNKDCKRPAKGVQLRNFSSWCNVNEDIILNLIAFHGPVITIVTASNWRGYNGGVIERACEPQLQEKFVHAVLIVGYDISEDEDIPYYIIKNSWGKSFGEDGYVRVKIGNNVCGVADEVTVLDVYDKIF